MRESQTGRGEPDLRLAAISKPMRNYRAATMVVSVDEHTSISEFFLPRPSMVMLKILAARM